MYNDLQWLDKNPTTLSNAIKLIQVKSIVCWSIPLVKGVV